MQVRINAESAAFYRSVYVCGVCVVLVVLFLLTVVTPSIVMLSRTALLRL